MHTVYVEILAILLLILLNGFFSLSEMAVVASRRVRLKNLAEAGNRRAEAALRLADSSDDFFSTVQIGITLIGIVTGAYGGATVATKLEGFFAAQSWSAPYSSLLGIGLVVVPSTYLTLVFGELVPKRLAFNSPERLAGATAPLMRVLMRVSLPAVRFLSWSTDLIIRLLGLHQPLEASVTEEEIRSMIGEGAKVGVLERSEKEMLERILRLGDRQARAMMTHRSKVVWLDLDDPWEENLRKIEQSPFSRFPVARGDLSNLIGVLKAKDFLAGSGPRASAELAAGLRQPLYVPETIRALKLLELFKHQPSMHFAAIVDEHGDIQGIITLNDILEAIVGDIPSVGEQTEPKATPRADGSWIMDGLLPMDEVFAILKLTAPDEPPGDYQTLAGFVLNHMGEIPVPGNCIEAHGYRFEVMDMDGKRIDAVLVSPQRV